MKKFDYVKQFEKLLHDGDCGADDLTLTYGSYDEETKKFTPSPDRNLDRRDDPDELVQIKWGHQSDEFCTYARIAIDGGYLILIDVMKHLDHWLR